MKFNIFPVLRVIKIYGMLHTYIVHKVDHARVHHTISNVNVSESSCIYFVHEYLLFVVQTFGQRDCREMAFGKKTIEEFGQWLTREGFGTSTVKIFKSK